MRYNHLPHLLCLLLALLLLSGCQTPPQPADAEDSVPSATELPAASTSELPASDPVSAPETVPAEPEYTGPSLTWQEAFRDKTLPEGVLTPGNIAFYQTDGETVSIVNVPREEVFSCRPERLPRTHYYEQYMSDAVREELLPILDYALAHGYCRCSIPTTVLSHGLLYQDAYFLRQTYRINDGGVGSLDVRTFDLEDGGTLIYLLATLPGMDGRGMMQQYLEATAFAEALVDSIPADYDEVQKAVFLYQYLTKHVRYNYGNYYGGSVNLLYDALIKHYTVCAGYTEALYYLYNLAGIECITVDGYDYTPGGGNLSRAGDLHIWNAARINGAWYQFDSTQDGGYRVEKYVYFGVSDGYMLEKHSNVVADKSQEYGPECPENLFLDQEQLPPEQQPEYQILRYCQLRSARDSDPLRIYEYYRPVRPSVLSQDPEDGWCVAATDESGLRAILETVMTPEEADRFCEDRFESRDGSLAFRPPEDDAPVFRLCRLTREAEDLWLVEGYWIHPDGASESVRAHVTVVQQDASWLVSSVRMDGQP